MRRFQREPELAKDYEAAINKYISEGYATEVAHSGEEEDKCFYLPHHGVYKKTLGPKKLRVVFNSAAPYKGKCLNDALATGPPLLNHLTPVLMKFREGNIAFTADITAMFSRIRMRKEDARFHRFLWIDKEKDELKTYQMSRLTIGDCCSPFVAVYATRKAAEDHGKEKEDAVFAIHNKLYMEYYLDSSKTGEEAIKRAREVDYILKQGDFHLNKWLSNDPTFNAEFQ